MNRAKSLFKKKLFMNMHSVVLLSFSYLLGALIMICSPRNWKLHRCDYLWSIQPVDPCSAETLIIRNCHNKSNWWYSLCRFPSHTLQRIENLFPLTWFAMLINSTTEREILNMKLLFCKLKHKPKKTKKPFLFWSLTYSSAPKDTEIMQTIEVVKPFSKRECTFL